MSSPFIEMIAIVILFCLFFFWLLSLCFVSCIQLMSFSSLHSFITGTELHIIKHALSFSLSLSVAQMWSCSLKVLNYSSLAAEWNCMGR